MFKKFNEAVSLILVLIMTFSSTVVFAYDNYYDDYYYQRSVKFYFNGESLYIYDSYIEGGRTIVPLRSVVEGIGGEVKYNGDTKTIGISYKNNKAILTENSDIMQVTKDGVTQVITGDIVPFYNKYGELMIPVRAIATAFDLQICWNNNFYSVVMLDTTDLWSKLEKEAPIFNEMLNQENKKLSGVLDGNFSFSANNDTDKLEITMDMNGRIKDNDVYLKSDGNSFTSFDGNFGKNEKYTNEFMLKDGNIYTRTVYENPIMQPMIGNLSGKWMQSQMTFSEEEMDQMTGKKALEKIVADSSINSYPTSSYEMLEGIINLYIVLEKNCITQEKENGLVTTKLNLDNNNVAAFLKGYARAYGYRDLTLKEYDDKCKEIDQMVKDLDITIQGEFVSKEDGSSNELLQGKLTIGGFDETINANFKIECNFTPNDNVEGIVAPAKEDIITAKDYYGEYYGNVNLASLLNAENKTKFLYQYIVPFYSNFAMALVK